MSSKTLTLVLALLLAFAGVLAAADAKGPETAVFQVPNLKDSDVVKKLTKVLADEAGVLSAKADAEAGQFLVTFEPGKIGSEELAKVLAKVAPEAKLDKVQPADPKAAKHDCGKCPSKAKCADKDKHKEKH